MGIDSYVWYISMIVYHIARLVGSSSVQQSSYIKIEKGHHAIDESIIDRTFTAISLAQCSYRCTKPPSWSLYFVRENQTCHCNKAESNRTYEDPVDNGVTYGYFDKLPRFKDCLEVAVAGFTRDGVYTINPDNQTAVDTWCDVSNGGWTVIQRRQDGSVDFYRGWSDYVTGFGNKSGEYWLGLDNIHALTTEPTELHIYMDSLRDTTPASAHANYSLVTVEDESQLYRIQWSKVTTSCGSLTNFDSGMNFSTFDSDNDYDSVTHCAEGHKGAWWFSSCGPYNLNGEYADGILNAACPTMFPIKYVVIKLIRTL